MPEIAKRARGRRAAATKTGRRVRRPTAGTTEALKGARTLCVDIGGTGIKAIVLDEHAKPLSERQRIETPRPATPAAILATVRALVKILPPFDRVAVGFPGVVKRSVVYTAPNLDDGWAEFPLGREIEKMTAKPTEVLNDAGVQGFGVITGVGMEMILTFGTGMGCAIYMNGQYVPNVELAHHPFKGKKTTYEDYVRNKQLKKIGKRAWLKRVREVVNVVLPIFNPDVLYLGGGNARLIKGKLPDNVRIVENIAGLYGGIALWKHVRPNV